ncbi:hypothetical protein BRARA_I03096 [Brassica rapa]|uniref:Uncharacterized protein n=1 Tax=Brassica campestris TaxID=3711 RepID=A0A397Y772_BRACM|nr:hypothetical protein BRARA_I03096 [Brassica rapa]
MSKKNTAKGGTFIGLEMLIIDDTGQVDSVLLMTFFTPSTNSNQRFFIQLIFYTKQWKSSYKKILHSINL